MIFNSVPIVGTYFRGADAVNLVNTLEAGMHLELRREPENEHDSNAIAAYYEGVHIGYVSRNIAAWIAPRVDDEPVAMRCIIESMEARPRGGLQPSCEVAIVGADAG